MGGAEMGNQTRWTADPVLPWVLSELTVSVTAERVRHWHGIVCPKCCGRCR